MLAPAAINHADNGMDCGKVEVKDPAKPDGLIVVRFLKLIVVPDAEVVSDIEEICFILAIEGGLKEGLNNSAAAGDNSAPDWGDDRCS